MDIGTSLSEKLQNLGFIRANEAGLTITKAMDHKEWGTFFMGEFAELANTVALDEEGWAWVSNRHVDLTPHGFKSLRHFIR